MKTRVSDVRSSDQRFDRSIVEGPLPAAVWKLAWPTMLQNMIRGLQGLVDHTLVGHFVGYTANAAIGVSWQIFLLVIVFIELALHRHVGARVAATPAPATPPASTGSSTRRS